MAPPSIKMRRKPHRRQTGQYGGGRDRTANGGQGQTLDILGKLRARTLGDYDQPAHAIGRQQPRRRGQATVRIDHDARRARPGHAADRQLRIVSQRGPNPDDHRVDHRAQPMQVLQPINSVDVMGMAGLGGHPPVQRLPELADDDEFVHLPGSDRPEQGLPGWRQRAPPTNGGWNQRPRRRIALFAWLGWRTTPMTCVFRRLGLWIWL